MDTDSIQPFHTNPINIYFDLFLPPVFQLPLNVVHLHLIRSIPGMIVFEILTTLNIYSNKYPHSNFFEIRELKNTGDAK